MEALWADILAGRHEQAERALKERVAARQEERGGHADEARAAEALGSATLAIRAWQLALRDDPTDTAAWEALARLHDERGDSARAASCRARLHELGGASGAATAPAEPEDPQPTGAPADADLVRFAHLFAGREDAHARMWFDPDRGVGYGPVRQPLTADVARAHLEGRVTVGAYLLRSDDRVTAWVLDLDAKKAALEHARGDAARIRDLAEAISCEGLRLLREVRALGLDPVLVDSGYKGRHLWGFLPEPTPAELVTAAVQRLARRLAPSDPRLALEAFPKQGALAPGGLGNLVKLPLGVHLRTGRRCALLGDDGAPLAEPFDRLRDVTRPALPTLLEPTPGKASLSAPPPAPPAPEGPAWTEAEFDTSTEVGPVLDGCAVLREAVREALETRRVSRDAAVVLNHSLGHLAQGVRACNYVYDRVPGFPEEARMGSPHRGSPISCARIRQRLPDVAARVPCACLFPAEAGRYDHPLRHLEHAAPPAAPADRRTLDDLLAAYGRQLERIAAAEQEADALRRAVVDVLGRVPGRRWRAAGGEWRLDDVDGEPALAWAPDERS